jgi:CheY-like chemotaxis protein
MSPEKARVFVAEDDKDWQDMIKEFLEMAGHTVVASARTLPEAMSTVKRLQDLKVDVAVIDGNLNEFDSDGYDGQSVLRAIREHAPRVRTVGMSGNPVRGTDVDLGKTKLQDIGDVVTKL